MIFNLKAINSTQLSSIAAEKAKKGNKFLCVKAKYCNETTENLAQISLI